jgi:hypothetical protein
MDDTYHKEKLVDAKGNQRKPNNSLITTSTQGKNVIIKNGAFNKPFNRIVQQRLTPNI